MNLAAAATMPATAPAPASTVDLAADLPAAIAPAALSASTAPATAPATTSSSPMSPGAWGMMLAVWIIVIFFAGYFLWRVFTLPQKLDNDTDGQDL